MQFPAEVCTNKSHNECDVTGENEMTKDSNRLMKNAGLLACACAVAIMAVAPVRAAVPVTASFTAQITIIDDCDIVSAGNMNFGTAGVLAAAVDATSTLSVQCTASTAYNIGLDAGVTGTIATRQMENGGAVVNYMMYSDSGRTSNWGETIGTDTVSATGNGLAQTHTIYGRVPAQSTPAANTYTDTVTVTVTF